MVSGVLATVPCTPIIDEGSEISCIDAAFAARCNLSQVPTTCSANASGNTAMAVTGQTADDVILTIPQQTAEVRWNLSKCIIVNNLGVDILIGEPAKVDNIIVTKSHLKKLETKDTNGNLVEIPYFQKKLET